MTRYYIYGLDPASKDDYFGIVGHELQPGRVPKLRAINALRHASFDQLYQYLVSDLFARMPPFYMVVDYTNEKTFSDMLVKDYGKKKVELISFGTDSKLMLKQDGLSILQQGYQFPNPDRLAQKPKTSSAAPFIRDLIWQLKSEQVLETQKTGKATFNHPPGQHNDLAIAWELSIHGCLRFMMKWQRARDNKVFVIHKKYGAPSEYDRYGSGVPRRAGVTTLSRSVFYPGESR